MSRYLLVKHDVAALEQRVHRCRRPRRSPRRSSRQVRNVDVVDRACSAPGPVNSGTRPCRALDRVEGDALRAAASGPCGPHSTAVRPGSALNIVALAGFEPVGIDVQFLNQYIAYSAPTSDALPVSIIERALFPIPSTRARFSCVNDSSLRIERNRLFIIDDEKSLKKLLSDRYNIQNLNLYLRNKVKQFYKTIQKRSSESLSKARPFKNCITL